MAHHIPWEKHMGGGIYHGYIETYVAAADFEAAATTDTVAMVGFPANAIPTHAAFNVAAYFVGGSVSASTMQLGDAGDPNGKLAALSVFDTTALGSWTVASLGVEAEYGSTGPALESAYAPILTITLTGDNCDNLTAGALACRLYYKRYAPA